MTEALPLFALGLARAAPPIALLVSRIARGIPWTLHAAVVVVLASAAWGWGVRPPAGSPVLDAAYLVAFARELALGAALALVLNAPLVALEHAGALTDTVAGNSSISPGPWSELIALTGTAVFLSAGALRGVLRALAASWDALPPALAPWPAGARDRVFDLALRATAETLGGAMLIASAGLLASAAVGLVVALASRFGAARGEGALALPLRSIALLGAVGVALGGATELVLDFADSAFRAARALH